MTTQITQRDKKLLAGLGVFVVVVLITAYVILPVTANIAGVNMSIENAQDQKHEMEAKIARLSVEQQAMEKAEAAWQELASQYAPLMTSQEIDSLVTDRTRTLGLTTQQLAISWLADDTQIGQYEETEKTASDGTRQTAVTLADAGLRAADVTLTADGDADILMALLDFAGETPGAFLQSFEMEETRDGGSRMTIEWIIYMCEEN
jgi:hypothetical protein